MAKKKPDWHKKANPDPEVAKNVAGQAKKGGPNRKALARLEIRIADWQRVYSQQKAPPVGAFHKPGSMQIC